VIIYTIYLSIKKTRNLKLIVFLILFCFSNFTSAQVKDTLIKIGNHKLSFRIYEGKGTLILFETGGGSDINVWEDILKPIAKITGAPIIAYSREDYGKSTVDTIKSDIREHGIINGVNNLEKGLKNLDIMKT